ncbi:MAG TPA: YetF domain-containing protein [Lacunisphaera sp.]|nr:YetF domain-containing protein [Lacunisphaera sp.]
MSAFLDQLLGLHTRIQDISWLQITARTIVVFIFGVALVRVADRRFLGRNAGFDVLLAIVLGSVLSRAINGQAPFLQTLGASCLLVILHRVIATIACRSSWFSRLVKGEAALLVKNGRIDHQALRRFNISLDDLYENLRLNGGRANPRGIAEARLERNGRIGVVAADNAS